MEMGGPGSGKNNNLIFTIIVNRGDFSPPSLPHLGRAWATQQVLVFISYYHFLLWGWGRWGRQFKRILLLKSRVEAF